MDEIKYCPLKASCDGDYYCDKEKCAWWVEKNLETVKRGKCAMLEVGMYVRR